MTYRLILRDITGKRVHYRNYANSWAIIEIMTGSEVMGGSMRDVKDGRKACRELNKEAACK